MKSRALTTASITVIGLILALGFLLSCGGGGGGSSNGSGGGGGTDTTLLGYQKATLSYSSAPAIGQPLAVALETDGTSDNIQWRLTSRPATSHATLSVAPDSRSASVTPDVSGEYRIAVDASIDGNKASTETNFTVRDALPFNPAKVARDDPATPIDEVIGVVQNQLFVFSLTRSEGELRTILGNYPEFTIVGYDSMQGLLVEYDDGSAAATQAIDRLKEEPGIDGVANRVHEGENAPRVLLEPDDGSAFDDGGDNWHLEHIGAPTAWETTTGSNAFFIGVSEPISSGYFKNHEELRYRFADVDGFEGTHGTAVAGTMAGRTDNGKGVSGINWETKLIASGFADIGWVLDKNKNGRKALLINNSWSMPGYPPSDFDLTDASKTAKRKAEAVAATRKYRNAAQGKYRDRLFVWAAGNGVRAVNSENDRGIPAEYHNGAVHLDDDGKLSKLGNTIVVAAIARDDRLLYNSDYGDTVDIAAPTRYKAPKQGLNEYYETALDYGLNDSGNTGGFSGTSAAAPVVTGAASLLLSIDPSLSPETIKQILISTATKSATQRYTKDADSGSGNENIEALVHPIPILNLAEAVRYLKKDFGVVIHADPRSAWPDENIFFSADVINGEPPFVYSWDFGDGGTSVLKSDSHSYAKPRTYTVTLTVTDAQDRTVTDSLQVRIRGKNTDDYVIWYTDNVRCWDAPSIYLTHRDTFNLTERRCDYSGGGIDCSIDVEKVELQGGFNTIQEGKDWFCPQITGRIYHYWCWNGARVRAGGVEYQLGIDCDLSGVPWE